MRRKLSGRRRPPLSPPPAVRQPVIVGAGPAGRAVDRGLAREALDKAVEPEAKKESTPAPAARRWRVPFSPADDVSFSISSKARSPSTSCPCPQLQIPRPLVRV